MILSRNIERALGEALRAQGCRVHDEGGDLWLDLGGCQLAIVAGERCKLGPARISLTRLATDIEHAVSP